MNELNSLNYENYLKMKNDIKGNISFMWQDRYLLNTLLKKFETIYPCYDDPEKLKEDKNLIEINKYISDFNDRKIIEKDFVRNIDGRLKSILERYPEVKYRNKYDINYYKNELSFANRLLITGEAGIGKSYYLYEFSEKLKNKGIPYLCIYGKYTKKISNSIMKYISNIDSEFYLIIDALNELSIREQKSILEFLNSIIMNSNVNIIVSYRIRNLSDKIENELKSILKNLYKFEGVDYEDSLEKLIENYGIEFNKYFNILETNNPAYLRMLYTIFDYNLKKNRKKYVDNRIGDLVQITSILEKYIKIICGEKYWDLTKNICSHMYNNNHDYITYKEIKNTILDDTDFYIEKMSKENLIDYYLYDGEKKYVFTMQLMSDYLIVRFLNNEIKNKNINEIIDIVNNKIKANYSWIEPIIILIFDKYKNDDITIALNIISNSQLKKHFNTEIIKKMIFNKEQIDIIQEKMNFVEDASGILQLGGFHDRPFNCVNYYNKLLLDDKNKIKNLSFKYSFSTTLFKLKNTLYNLILINKNNSYVEEMFWYSFWLSSSSIDRVRNLCLKVLYEICLKFPEYCKKLLELYSKVDEYYLKKTIIHILSSINDINEDNIHIFEQIYNDYEEIDYEIILRLYNTKKLKKSYIELNKKNIYKTVDGKYAVDKELDLKHILMITDIYEKYLLNFERYHYDDVLNIHEKLILNDKNEITKWNNQFKYKFKCISENGYCEYSLYGSLFKKIMPSINYINYSEKNMFIMYQEIFKKVCNYYNYSYDKTESFDEHLNPFSNSILRKCLLISQDLMYGSLMCNYYTNKILQNGYELFEPFTMNEKYINVCTPISLYCEDVQRLNNKIEKKFDLNGIRDNNWYMDNMLPVDNLKSLLIPISYGGNEWIPICIEIHKYVSDDKYNHLYTESYDWTISIDASKKLLGDSNSSKLTIEKEKYEGNILKFNECSYIKSVYIKTIEYDSKDFKNTNLSFPPPAIIKELKLHYDTKNSTWKNSRGDIVLYCDNNNSDFYSNPITNSIYMRKDYFDIICEKFMVLFWAYTEKNYLNKGWNEEASLHLEFDSKGNIISKYKNNSLKHVEESFNNNCKKCKYGIFRKLNKPISYPKINLIIDDLIKGDEEKNTKNML